ncbi:MAG: class I SAM-dependent methyltransferase [Myxococcota bacterium]
MQGTPRDRMLALLWKSRESLVPTDFLQSRVELEGSWEGPVDAVLDALRDDGLVANSGGWQLAPAGLEPARIAFKAVMRSGFDDALLVLEDSKAFRKYCERAYGWGRFSFNMVDRGQRDALVEVCGLGPGKRFVDLGCATGTMTAWLAEVTGADGMGVDFAPQCIARASERYPNVRFEVQDLDDAELPPRAFDVAVAIDTLYFPERLDDVIRAVFAALREGGALVALYSTTADAGVLAADVPFEETKLGRVLAEQGRAVELWEVTDSEQAVWRRARAAVDALRTDFEDEGNAALWARRDAEASGQLALIEAGRKRRWIVRAR